MKFSRQTLREIRERIDFVELVSGYTTLERKGDRWWGLSPFKSEKTPSFTVKPEEGFYYCFATQRGGDIFRFVSEMEGLNFPEAVKFLAERAGVTLQQDTADPDEADRNALYGLYERVAGTFNWFLNNSRGNNALSYLRDRGVTDDAIVTFQIGYAPDSTSWLYRFLRSKSYSPEFLAKSGLFSQKKREFPLFRNRIIFPIRDERDRVVAFGGRALNPEDRAKYMNSPDTLIYNKKRTVYGLPQAIETIRAERRVYIVEGYTDVIAMHQGGVRNTVAPLGTALTESQVRLLKRWAHEIVLVFDADSAGVDASFRASLEVEKADLGCFVLPMRPGLDPADLYNREGARGLGVAIQSIQPAFDFLLEKSAERTDTKDSRARELLLRKLFPYIKVVRSEVRREALLEQVGDTVQVPVAAIRSDLRQWAGSKSPVTAAEDAKKPKERKQNRDFALMLACVQRSEFFAYLRNTVSHEDLEDRDARHLYFYGEDAFRHGDSFPRGVLDRIQDEEMRTVVLQRLTSGEYSGWTLADVEAAARQLRMRKLIEKQRNVEMEIRTVQTTDNQRMRRLLEEKMAIDQELSQLKVRADD